MPRVLGTPVAARFKEIGAHLAQASQSRRVALRFLDRIAKKCELHAAQPELGETCPDLGNDVSPFCDRQLRRLLSPASRRHRGASRPAREPRYSLSLEEAIETVSFLSGCTAAESSVLKSPRVKSPVRSYRKLRNLGSDSDDAWSQFSPLGSCRINDSSRFVYVSNTCAVQAVASRLICRPVNTEKLQPSSASLLRCRKSCSHLSSGRCH